ncbi:hypothetical protein MIS46_05370 [Wielerella bovis]|uniref:hypothetical protein n=1 Tax=Wielerella bovis TaxID=2917790 RepID=UPI00201888ED|nr:hypothetical protein [Wielerella bovis]ULJ61360.1 hypothetical protein MIS44_05825 [Wielerella bovis]ULJ63476.1 hypothetical protein MIS46_05370 [Wielerella bovis]
MLNTINEIRDSVKESIKKRMKSSLVGTFITSWIIFNWKPILYFLFINGDIDARIKKVEELNNYLDLLLLPLIMTIIYVVGIPFISSWVATCLQKPNQVETSIIHKNELEEIQRKISLEEAKNNLTNRSQMNTAIDNLNKEIQQKNEEIQQKNEEIQRILSESSNTQRTSEERFARERREFEDNLIRERDNFNREITRERDNFEFSKRQLEEEIQRILRESLNKQQALEEKFEQERREFENNFIRERESFNIDMMRERDNFEFSRKRLEDELNRSHQSIQHLQQKYEKELNTYRIEIDSTNNELERQRIINENLKNELNEMREKLDRKPLK